MTVPSAVRGVEEIQRAEGATLKPTPTMLLQVMVMMDTDPHIYVRQEGEQNCKRLLIVDGI